MDADNTKRDEISTPEIKNLLEDIHLLKPEKIVFTGGEPLLRNDIFDLANSLKKLKSIITLALNTNGSFVTNDNASMLVSLFDEIRISIDSFEKINDKIRGKGAYKYAIQSFHKIIKHGGNPITFVTVTNESFPYLTDFIRFLIENKINRFHLIPVKIIGRASGYSVEYNYEALKNKISDFWYQHFGRQLIDTPASEITCGIERYIAIYPDGSVFPCHRLALLDFCMGNVRNTRLIDLYQESNVLKKYIMFKIDGISTCDECYEFFKSQNRCRVNKSREETGSCLNY